MVNLGIVSFAHLHAFSYAAAMNALPGVAFAGIWDAKAARGKRAAKDYKTKFYASLDKLFEQCDGVIVCSENAKHRQHVEAAAKAGKWVLCEKPLATTVADAKAMIAACKKASVGLGTAFPCRFIQPLADAKRRVDAGELGKLFMANCTNNGSYPGEWFGQEALSGGGATMDHTVHVADLLRWLTGKEITKVYCETGKLIHTKLNTDDMGVMHFEMQGGLKVSHIASWNRPEAFPTWGDVTMELVGEKGVLNVDAFAQKLDVYSEKTKKMTHAGWGDNADLLLVRDFVEAVRDKRQPAVTGEDGLRAVEVTTAAYTSAKKGKMVPV